MQSLAAKFFRLFAGLDRSYGRYSVPPGAKPDAKGKLHDRTWAKTVHGKLTQELFEGHLKGDFGLGVVPIRDDATCVFGAIDIDDYKKVDFKVIVADLIRFRLPLIPCRTKSAGAHLYLFMSRPASAELVRSKLMEWAVLLGHPGVEIFPKQTKLASTKDDGSWINLPYQSGKRSTRYAFNPDLTAMTPEEFAECAERFAVSPEELDAFVPPKQEDDGLGDFLLGAPPCLQTLSKKGFGDWQNNGLFNLGVYLRKRFGDGWEAKLDEYNRKLMNPPVGHSDVAAIAKSVAKKNYSYMCKQEPICGVCNRQLCLTREFGVGGLGDDPGVTFGELVKLETDPPTYIWDVDGARIELTVEDLMDQRRFQKLVITKLNKWPSMVRPATWQKIVRESLTRLEIIEVPFDATKEGQFWVHVQRFCTSKVRGRSLDELLMGKPYSDKDGRTYFCAADLFQYMAQHKFNGVTEKDVFKWMRKRGVEHHEKVLKGKFMNYWSLPSFPEQTEPHDVPKPPPTEKM